MIDSKISERLWSTNVNPKKDARQQAYTGRSTQNSSSVLDEPL